METPSPLHAASVALVQEGDGDEEVGCIKGCVAVSECPTTAPKDTLSEAELLAEDAAATERRRRALGLKPAASHGLGVAFSGGGVRAASFDCGVLAKLAELGLAKEVDQLSAVSGGGYSACAYATHLQYCDVPLPTGKPEAADDWYRDRTAAVVARMQDNIGYLVTCSHSLCAAPGRAYGSAYGRAWDIPAFAALLVGMPLANIMTFFAFYVMPATAWVNLNHGHSMRSRFCDKAGSYAIVPSAAIGACVVSTVAYAVLKLTDGGVALEPPRYARWLCHRTATILFSRLAIAALVYAVLIVATMGMEVYDFGTASKELDVKCACAKYFSWDAYGWSYETYAEKCEDKGLPLVAKQSFALFSIVVFGAALAVAALFSVLSSPASLGLVIRVGAPLAGIFAISYVAQYRVFGPVTEQQFVTGALAYDATRWSVLFLACCVFAVLHLPSQHELPRTLHRFYARSLRRAFFCLGRDAPLEAFASDLAGGTPPPNLILGATVNEFRRPSTRGKRGMPFTLTPRGWGGAHTGYARPPRWLDLSRAMALSGAAIDGFVLTEFKSKSMRMALQVLNLTMGDTVRFSCRADDDDRKAPVSPLLALATNATHAPSDCLCGPHSAETVEAFRGPPRVAANSRCGDSELAATLRVRASEMALFASVYVLFALSAAFYSKSDDKASLYGTPSPMLASAALLVMFVAVCASVFTHADRVRFLLCSPIIQQIHLLMQCTNFNTRTPPFLTLTDGGLVECIGVVELLRRRCRYVVVVDTTEDPNLEMKYLTESLKNAVDQGLVASPFVDGDGDWPLEDLLSPKIANLGAPRLASTYADGSTVDVFVVKMRKPADHATKRCQPLIHPREIASPGADLPRTLVDPDAEPLDLPISGLNGLCAECCHATCACMPCGNFPFLSVGNQFLTPTQFANLARLGADLSAEPLAALKAARGE